MTIAIFTGNILKVFPVRIDQEKCKKNCNPVQQETIFQNCKECLLTFWINGFFSLTFVQFSLSRNMFDMIFDAKDIWPHHC